MRRSPHLIEDLPVGQDMVGPAGFGLRRMRIDHPGAEQGILFPARDRGAPRLRLGEYNGIALDAFRFDTLDPLFDMASRIGLLEVA